jgi:cation diffusion facilitator family transporter
VLFIMQSYTKNRQTLTRFAWLSVGAAIITIALKGIAYFLTGSVGLLSDALESIVNLAGALMALGMLSIAARPADDDHAYGHSKAEYFASGVEGMLILVAALGIVATAIPRLITPKPLEQVGVGLVVSVGASLINLFVSIVLSKASKKYNSITLEADGKHLMTDVWTSAGVLAGVGVVALTGWELLDPIVALLVAGNIVWSGVRIVRKSAFGLMDTSIPLEDQKQVQKVLESYIKKGVQFHALRTRESASRRFVSIHVLVPGDWTVNRGHFLLENIEADIRHLLPDVTVFTHLESLDDPSSWEDMDLDRNENASIKYKI